MKEKNLINMKTIGIITMEKVENREFNSVGSSRIRARWLLPYWEEAEEYHIGRKYDVLIFQKAYYKKMLQDFQGIKIFDICDPDWLEPKPVFETISYCNAVVCATETLAEYIKKFVKNKPIIIIPDRVNLDEVKIIHPEHKEKAKTCVWFGYSSNLIYVERTFDFLASMGLSLTIISETTMALPQTKLDYKFIKYRFNLINEEVVKYDFVIMPDTSPDTLDLNGRLKYKSNNKTIQSWAWGMPVAYNPKDIERFMSGEEREKERLLRLKEVKEKWDVRLSVKEYKELILELKGVNSK